MSRFVLTAQLQLQAPNNVAQVVRQIQSQLNNVTVNVQVQNAQQAQRQLQQVTNQTNQATSAASKMGKAFAVSVRRFAAFSIATRAVGLFTSTLSDAVQTAIDFERELIKISQVTGKSVNNLRNLTNTITSLSTSFGVSSNSLLEVSTILAQAGLQSEDTAVALKTLAKAALAPNFDSITETAEGAIAILAQFQEGVGALERQLGSINAVAGAFAVEAGDLIDVVRRTGGVFKSSGGSLNELLALFTSVRATTRESAESIGTGLRTIFTRIQRPKTIEFLKQFGVELVDLEGKFVGPYEAIRRLSEGLAGLGERDITFIKIAEELGGFRQIGKVLPLLQQFATAEAALNVATKANNSLSEDAISAQAALAIRITKVKEEFLALVRSITETSTFQIMANTALSLASALIKIADAIKPLIPLLAAVASFKIAKGLGSFAGSVAKGFGFNKGGKVHAFARGGLVPGSGNRDTVPAMLQPGEFVIRKSSVNRLGAGNLAAMNANRFATGGKNPTGKELAQQLGPSGREVVAGKTYKAGEFGSIGLMESVSDEIAAKLATEKSLYGAVFLEPLAQNQFLEGKLDTKQISKKVLGSNSYKSLQLLAKKDPKAMELLNGEVKEIVATADKPSSGFNISLGSLSANTATSMKENILQQVSDAVISSAQMINNELGIKGAPEQARILKSSGIEATVGNIFEAAVTSVSNKEPFMGRDASADFDYPAGIGSAIGAKFGISPQAFTRPSDAKNFLNQDNIKSLNKKVANFETASAIEQIDSSILSAFGEVKAKQARDNLSLRQSVMKKHFGGLIQKFAKGGMATAPLIDDIVNASGTVMPRPSSAIAALIKAGGGAIDIDRTLKRTIGDKAYGMAKTSGQQSAALNKYFRDPNARLKDVTSAPLTVFGKELQTAIKSGQLQPGKLSIISKSQRVPGVAEYLSKLFGIPLANMIFTQGGSKQPAMDALRAKGPRSTRVARFATGGGVGTDTVPALLTPGEFVVNRASAQSIGYGNLNRMNKVGKYAKGGVVQHFASGTSGTGAKPIVSNIPVPGFDIKAPTLLNKAIARITGSFTLLDVSIGNANNEMRALKKFAPQVYQALALYANETNLTTKQQVKLASAYNNIIGDLLKQGATDDQILRSMETYATSLNEAAANVKKQSVAAVATTAASTASAVSTAPSNPFASMTGSMGKAAGGSGGVSGNTDAVNDNTKAQKDAAKSAMDVVSNNKMLAASMGVSLIQGFLPAVDENSSMLLKFSTSVLGIVSTITTLGFALEAFGVNLTLEELTSLDKMANRLGLVFDNVGRIGSGVVDSFRNMISTQAASAAASTASATADTAEAAASAAATAADTAEASASTAAAASNLGKALGGFAIGATVAYLAVKTFSDAIRKSAEDLNKKKIEAGDVEGARQAGENLGSVDFAELLQNYGATIGTVAGGVGGFFAGGAAGTAVPIVGNIAGAAAGTAVGAAAGGITGAAAGRTVGNALNYAFGPGDAAKAMGSVSASAAQLVKTNKILENSSDKAAKALENVQAGTMSLREALDSLSVETQSSVDAMKLAQQANAAEEKVASKQTTGFGRTLGAFATFGYIDSNEEVQGRKNSVAERTRESQRIGQQQLRTLQPMMQQQMRITAITGGDFDSFLDSLSTAELELLNMTENGVKNAYQSFVNISKEIEISRKALEAMNLGLRGPTSTATAMSASMDRFVAGLEVGGNTFVANAQFLSEAMTGAAQAMDNDQIKSAMGNVRDNLEKMGISQKYLDKFETNTSAFVQAQQNYNEAFNNIRANIQSQREKGLAPDISPVAIKEAFAKELTAGLGDGAKKNLTDIINNIQLDEGEVNKILAGDLSVFGDKLTEAGKKQFEEIIKIAQERQKAEQVIINLTKSRIEAERNLVEAQKEALDLYSEGRDIQAKFGGAAVTPAERRNVLLAKSNIETNRLGMNQLKSGSVEELRARNKELMGSFSAIEAQRSTDGGMQGVAGVSADEAQKDIQKAYKSQIETIRNLIKLEEEELKIIQEKNKLEKQSLESLIAGDIEKFFEQQAAVGAQAAIATGNESLMNAFGGQALGTAFTDLQRQQEAGVTTAFGQQIGGAGGLLERGAGAALAARGVQDPLMAQRLAGTTPEEEARKANLRGLGGVLAETGQVGIDMAQMQLSTAEINVDQANIKMQDIIKEGNKAASGFMRGGIVYASRGMFVPRGTDTVPAMLTPGEFVVNRAAVNRGNNLQLLQAINGNTASSPTSNVTQALARGGRVQYLADGGIAGFIKNMMGPDIFSGLIKSLTAFGSQMAENIKSLNNTKFKITLDTTNVNVNLNGGSFLSSMKEEIKQQLMSEISKEIQNYGTGPGNKLTKNQSTLPSVRT